LLLVRAGGRRDGLRPEVLVQVVEAGRGGCGGRVVGHAGPAGRAGRGMVRRSAAVMVEGGGGGSGRGGRVVVMVMVMRLRHDHAVRRHRWTVRDAVPGRLRGPAAQLAGGAADVHVAAVRVDHPVVAFARVVEAPRYLDETLVQRQVVPDAVLPRGRVHPVERELVHDVFVDAAEREPLLRALRYGHHYQSVVTVIGFLVFVVDWRRCGGRVVLVLADTVPLR